MNILSDIQRFIIPRRYFNNQLAFGVHWLVTVIFQEGLRAIIVHRFCHWLYKRRLRGLSFVLAKLSHFLNGVYIAPRTMIGPGCKINHSGSVIHAEKIGKNIEITHNVTIGQKTAFADKYPSIGDNVYIGAGARVIADIGNNVIVAANAVVVKDVGDHILVAGVPGKEVKVMDS